MKLKSPTASIYIVSFIATVLVCTLLLALCTLLPQDNITKNIQDSAEQMSIEGMYPRSNDGFVTAQLDNFTDAIILQVCATTNSSDVMTIFTNPIYQGTANQNPVNALYQGINAENPQTEPYARYWMGFRVLMRAALCVLNYYQIKRYAAFLFFLLFICVAFSLERRLNLKYAVAFAVSILLVRPYVISNSIQFSCCFFIALLAMLAVPWLKNHRQYELLFFMELGMLTMYFDFYTTPIITFAYPMIYLYLLRLKDGEKMSIKNVFKCFAAWIIAWLMMWIVRLGLVSLLTEVDGFGSGFGKAAMWLGVNKSSDPLYQYSSVLALKEIVRAVLCDRDGLMIWALAAVVSAGFLVYKTKRGQFYPRRIFQNKALLFIALMPIVWFAVAAQPTTTHYWFQYRSISAAFFAVGACLAAGFPVYENPHG